MTTRDAREGTRGLQKRGCEHPEPRVAHGEGDFERAGVQRLPLEPSRRADPEHPCRMRIPRLNALAWINRRLRILG